MTKYQDIELPDLAALKNKLNPKNRGNIVDLQNIDPDTLSEREKLMLRVINDIEEKLGTSG